MAGAMKPAATAFALILLGTLSASASLLPADWMSVQLANAGATNSTNQWFFFPDAQSNPRIVAKTITGTASVARSFLTGGPPAWAASDPVSTAGLNKEGVFVPTGADSGFLVGPHESGTYKMRMLTFSGGTVGDSVVDTIAATGLSGISAALDPAGNLHASWIWSPGANESLVYARRSGAGVWEITDVVFARPQGGADNGKRIGDTAVVPSAFGTANVYFTLTTPVSGGSVTSLMRMNSLVNGGQLFLTDATVLITQAVKTTPLRGTRVGSSDRLYYFEGNVLRRWNGSGATDVQGAVAGAVPLSIQVGISPVDGRQRVAWYDSNTRKIHYLKPGTTDLTYTAYNPVTIPGNSLPNADLYGLHFNSAGLPYILYRRGPGEGYVAFPNDEFDTSGNGHPEIVDEGLTSPQGALEVLPVKAAVAGVMNSADRFKIRFTTPGSTAVVASLPRLESTTTNLRYEVEVSTNGTTWTKLTANNSITFTKTAESGTSPNLVRTYVGVFPEPAPGNQPLRFARLIVTRKDYPY